MSKYLLKAEIAEAKYTTPIQVQYQNNPIIEALPEPMQVLDLFEKLTEYPQFGEDERKFEHYQRMNFPALLHTCFQPWNIHIDLARKFLNAILLGYSSRNPMRPEQTKDLSQLYNCVKAKDAEFKTAHLTNSISAGFSVIGYSGMGKTSSIERVLSMYPKVIVHKEFKGVPFHHLQIVWMRLECPIDGGIKGLCSSFFSKFDELTNDNTYEKFVSKGRSSTDQLIPQMALLARRHSLGALVIDEIQNINAAKSGGIEHMLNFISNMVNTIGVPVILIGIEKAIEVISMDLMRARRSTGMGAVIMERLEKGSEDWNTFIKGIWHFQWTNIETPLDQNIKDVMYDMSFGIVDVAVNLYIATQIEAIKRGETGKSEDITPKLIEKVANSSSFSMLRKKVEKMKKGGNAIHIDEDIKLSWDKIRKECDIGVVESKWNTDTKDRKRNDELQESISISALGQTSSHVKGEVLSAEALLKDGLIVKEGGGL